MAGKLCHVVPVPWRAKIVFVMKFSFQAIFNGNDMQALLPMLPSHLLEGVPGKTVLALSFVTCLVLNTASHELWLSYETGNANFFFGMNLAWFAWQAMTLSLLLRAQKALPGKLKQL